MMFYSPPAYSNSRAAVSSVGNRVAQSPPGLAFYRTEGENIGIDPSLWSVPPNSDPPLARSLVDIGAKLAEVIDYHGRGDYEQAGDVCQEILHAHPNHPDALHLMGLLAGRRRDYSRAIELLEQAIDADQAQPTYLLNLGKIRRAAGCTQAAVDAYRRSLVLDPMNPEAHSDLGAVLHESGDLDGAVACYRRALEANPDRARVLYNLGVALRELGRIDEAIEQMQRMLERVPRHPAPHLMLAGLLLERGDAEAALETCERCLKHEKRNRLGLALKSVALARTGDLDASRVLLDMDRLVAEKRLEPPAGYQDLESFNHAIAAEIRSRLDSGSAGGDARDGAVEKTEELLVDASGALATLAEAFRAAVERYLGSLPREVRHPYLGWRPRRLRVSGSGIVISTETHLEPHVREAGWVTGTYHVSGAATGTGGFEIGRPPPRYAGETVFEARTLSASAGHLALFPSYLFLSARPTEPGDESIAVVFHAATLATSDRWW